MEEIRHQDEETITVVMENLQQLDEKNVMMETI
jgi:hypothetical protein